MRFTPLKQKGRRGHLNDRIRATVFPRVLQRSGWKCEACGVPASQQALDWAHLAGREGTGAGLGPWANSEYLTSALCREHHNAVDRHLDPELAKRLRREALHRLHHACPTDPPGIRYFTGTLDEARQLVALLESFGWTYDADQQKPVRAA